MKVSFSRLHFPTTTLGPGRRLGLWLQGCSIRCPGCISIDTWKPGGVVDLDDLLTAIDRYAPDSDGLTVSGGEPFDQPKPLAAILSHWRACSKRSVLVFTGREFEELSGWFYENPGLVDAVISGPFRADLPQTLALRGSDNQRLHILSDIGKEMIQFERPAEPEDRRLDVMFDEKGLPWMAGIPTRGDIARLRRALATAGHSVVTSAELKAFHS